MLEAMVKMFSEERARHSVFLVIYLKVSYSTSHSHAIIWQWHVVRKIIRIIFKLVLNKLVLIIKMLNKR